nr:hypothetical protein [Acidobacteriota bacterium]
VAALERAAPVYRPRWGTEHDRANRAWIATVRPMVKKFAGTLANQIASAYHTSWPSSLLRVDVVSYASWAGAYTTLDPNRITISNNDPRQEGYAAFETLFHESSHVLIDVVRNAIARECQAQNKAVPRDLWHAMLFYTTGELVRKRLAQQGVSNYVPYAYKNGLFTRAWPQFIRPLEQHWQAYLDGRTDFDSALKKVVAEI